MLKTRIKVCGITNLEDAITAIYTGADAIGMIFARSPRRVGLDTAAEIIHSVPPFVSVVGVFVNPSSRELEHIMERCRLNLIQLHGDESPETCDYIYHTFKIPVIKAFRMKDRHTVESFGDFDVYAYLVDAYDKLSYGGTGKTFDWELLEGISRDRLILSGGLTPENVFDAVKAVRPAGVDVSSGVESVPGVKDRNKIVQFVSEVRRADSAE